MAPSSEPAQGVRPSAAAGLVGVAHDRGSKRAWSTHRGAPRTVLTTSRGHVAAAFRRAGSHAGHFAGPHADAAAAALCSVGAAHACGLLDTTESVGHGAPLGTTRQRLWHHRGSQRHRGPQPSRRDGATAGAAPEPSRRRYLCQRRRRAPPRQTDVDFHGDCAGGPSTLATRGPCAVAAGRGLPKRIADVGDSQRQRQRGQRHWRSRGWPRSRQR
mmetsp:Transcript_32655/g.90022  ORF Transcript_32655/g.90022 Transcript_32655/m.90022 type:complete len:215 (+) Transcript_32655:1645-2289(+)